MEEDVDPRDADGVDGRGIRGWDGRVCGLGAISHRTDSFISFAYSSRFLDL